MRIEWRYLDLMKKAILHLVWNDPGIPFSVVYNMKHGGFRDYIAEPEMQTLKSFEEYLKQFNLYLMFNCNSENTTKNVGKMLPHFSDSMLSLKRFDNIQYCAEYVLQNNVPGDFIETGVWRGGACIFMRAILEAYGIKDRNVFVADSFKGLPPPDTTKYPDDAGDYLHEMDFLAIDRADVEARFAAYGLLDGQVKFIEGWFEDTMPSAPVESLAILRLDGDMYGSTMVVLEHLYPKLSPGGFCIIDDYCLPNCRQAVHDYFRKVNISPTLVNVDSICVYWQK